LYKASHIDIAAFAGANGVHTVVKFSFESFDHPQLRDETTWPAHM